MSPRRDQLLNPSIDLAFLCNQDLALIYQEPTIVSNESEYFNLWYRFVEVHIFIFYFFLAVAPEKDAYPNVRPIDKWNAKRLFIGNLPYGVNEVSFCSAGMACSMCTLWHGQNNHHDAEDVFKCIFLKEKFCIMIHISLKCVPECSIGKKLSLVQVMVWCWLGDEPLPELMTTQIYDSIWCH